MNGKEVKRTKFVSNNPVNEKRKRQKMKSGSEVGKGSAEVRGTNGETLERKKKDNKRGKNGETRKRKKKKERKLKREEW